MGRGDRQARLLKIKQVKRYANEEGIQISSGAIYAIQMHLENILKDLCNDVKKHNIKRLKSEQIYALIEKQYMKTLKGMNRDYDDTI
tara:strand:+ start:227 stop:487 length:261 start_codon:yes stop_codon:yes gene_type:complete